MKAVPGAAERAAASALAQGLPEHVEDPEVIRRVVKALKLSTRAVRGKGRNGLRRAG